MLIHLFLPRIYLLNIGFINKNMLEKLKTRVNSVRIKSQELLETVKLPEEMRQSRYTICNNCEFFYEPTTTCSKCGCIMAVKTYLPFASCPVGKWPTINIFRE